MGRYGSDKGATIKTITFQGRTVDLNVDGRGTFYATLADERIESKSLDGLHDKVKKAIGRLGKVRIPITLMEARYDDDKPSFEDAFLTGYQTHRRCAIVEDSEGRVDTLHHYSKTICRRMTQAEKNTLIAAWKDKKRSEKHYDKLNEDAQIESVPKLLEETAAKIDDLPPAAEEEEPTNDPRL